MMRQLLLILLLLVPQTFGFLNPPSTSKHVASSRASYTKRAPALALSGDATLIDQLTDPLLLQHMATGGALAFAGDVIAQSLLSGEEEKSIPPKDWDVVRTNAFVVFGALYTGGAQHFIFNYLNNSFDEPLARLAMAQFFFIPFCYYPTFLFMTPALRAGWEHGFGSEEAKARQNQLFSEVASKIPPTLLRNWCFWLPVQFVQFNFIPAELNVTFTAAFGVIWNAILSWSTAAGKQQTAAEKEA
jgi:protein Mpv17